MTTDGKTLTGKVINSKGSASRIAGLDAVTALGTMVNTTFDYLRLREEERTKRVKLETYERTELRKIEAAESVLKDYFRQVFAERKANVDELFARYDEAVQRGDAEAAHVALGGVVDLAKTSPLADLGDLGQIRNALDDAGHVWDL